MDLMSLLEWVRFEWLYFEAKARDNPSQVAPSHTDITRDARGNNLLLDDDYR